MFITSDKKNNYKLENKEELLELSGFCFGSRGRTHKVGGQEVLNIVIYNKKLAHPIVIKQVEKKFNKLMNILPDLLVSDDSDGSGIMEALNEIEKFRQIIKNKYRMYLKKQELEAMSKKLSLIQKQAKSRLVEINYQMQESYSRSSSRK